MTRITVKRNVDLTLKLLLTIAAYPSITTKTLAKATGASESWVVLTMGRLREAGVDLEFDRTLSLYKVDLGPTLEQSVLGKYVRKLRKEIADAAPPQEVRVVPSSDRYTVVQFAEYLGTSQSNVGNMIAGFKGQSLPEGWVAYRLNDSSRWIIQRMEKTPSGTRWRIPDNIKATATEYVIGRDGDVKVKGAKKKQALPCIAPKCANTPRLAKRCCSFHYYQVRRHPELLKQWEKAFGPAPK